MPYDKRIPGEYAPLYWDGDGTPCAHYVNGHVTDEEFRAAVNAYHRGDLAVPPDAKIERVYVRNVRAEADRDFDREWRQQRAPGRGAFAMTVWNIDRHRGVAPTAEAPYVSAADRCRAAIKAAGWTARQVTVRDIGGSLDSSLVVTIRDRGVSVDDVRAIAKTIEVVHRDGHGEVCGGGNTYVRVVRATPRTGRAT